MLLRRPTLVLDIDVETAAPAAVQCNQHLQIMDHCPMHVKYAVRQNRGLELVAYINATCPCHLRQITHVLYTSNAAACEHLGAFHVKTSEQKIRHCQPATQTSVPATRRGTNSQNTINTFQLGFECFTRSQPSTCTLAQGVADGDESHRNPLYTYSCSCSCCSNMLM
jgi:hypothetical protein